MATNVPKHLARRNKTAVSRSVVTTLVAGFLLSSSAGSALAAEPKEINLERTSTTSALNLSPEITASPDAVITFERQAVTSIKKKEEPKKEEPKKEESKVEVQEVAPVAPMAPAAVQPATAPTAAQAPAVAYDAPQAVSQASVGVGNKAIADAALAQLGVMQDCTMLVTNSLAAVGINYHGWPAGYKSLGTIVPADEAQPGDLIYYDNAGAGMPHIAVYIGNGQAVHGGFNGGNTAIAPAELGSGGVYIRVS
ncbi:MAG: C40 family peptidase [Enterococcus sp.]|nr:C40 family peptidase [Enterococcus sp.]